jgi:co-chaperonin GroES (HSP10)
MTIKQSPIWYTVRPLGERVWGYPLYKDEVEETSESGLIISTQLSPKKLLYAMEIVRIGPDVKHDISEGDIVTLDPNSGGEVISITDDDGEIHNIFSIHAKHLALVLEG